MLKEITQKRQKVDSKIEQLQKFGKLTSGSATKVKLTLSDLVTSGISSTKSEESRQVIHEVKSSLGLALQNLKDDSSSNLNLNKLENLVAQLDLVDHDDEDSKEQVVLITAQIGEEKQKLLDKLEDDHTKGIIDQTTYENLKKKLDKFSVAQTDLHGSTVAAAVMVTQRPEVTQSIIDQIKSNLILDKLREELGEENYDDMKEDLKSLTLLASSLKEASTEQKTEMLKEISKKPLNDITSLLKITRNEYIYA